MNLVIRNWKTTSSGAALILTGLTGVLHLLNPDIPGPDIGSALSSIIAGIGLLVAKDFNVSGTKK